MVGLQFILLLILFPLCLWLLKVILNAIAEREAHNPEHEAHGVKRRAQNAERQNNAKELVSVASAPQLESQLSTSASLPIKAHMTVTLYQCQHCHKTLYPPREVRSPYVGEDTTRAYFCSDQCYKNALETFLPEHFRQGATFRDSPEMQTLFLKCEQFPSLYSREEMQADVKEGKQEWTEKKPLYTSWAATDLKSSIRDTYYEMGAKNR